MSFGVGGLQSFGKSIASIIAQLVGQALTAASYTASGSPGFTATVAAGNDAYLLVNGAFFRLTNSGTAVRLSGANGQVLANLGASGTQGIALAGQANINATPVGTGADTTEDNLMTYSLPANSMDVNGRMIRVTAWGDGVNTADATTLRCYFGATAVVTKVLTASQANTWKAVYEVIRTGAATQAASGTLVNGGTAVSTVQINASPGETTSGAITIKCTGQRATSSVANSVRQLGMLVEFFN